MIVFKNNQSLDQELTKFYHQKISAFTAQILIGTYQSMSIIPWVGSFFPSYKQFSRMYYLDQIQVLLISLRNRALISAYSAYSIKAYECMMHKIFYSAKPLLLANMLL